jgi:hypothetical protein
LWQILLPAADKYPYVCELQGQEGPLHVPDFIAELVQQIMLGDTDAM